MSYLILHYFFMVCICNKRIAGFSSRRTNNYDIDDFINQLLASQKFDELAEKVAEKAVKKIKNMEGGAALVEKIMNKNFKEDEELQHRYQEKNRDLEDKEISNKDREERSNNVENKPGRINTEVLMKKEEDSSQSDSLTLKYKYIKQHAIEKKSQNVDHSGSEEHDPVWRNVQNSDKQRRPIEMRQQENIQIRPLKHYSGEKEADKNYEKNLKFEKASNYDKKTQNNNYEKEGDRYTKESDGESFKTKFFNEHEREQEGRDNPNPVINERGRDETISRNQDDDQNDKPRFKSEHAQIASHEDAPAIIDLDDNNEGHNKKGTLAEEPKNVYKELDDDQKIVKSDFQNDDADEDETTPRDSENVFPDDRKPMEDDVSDDDDTYRKLPDSENEVTSEYAPNDYTTRKRLIRREGNKYYTYLSAPEYAEYHDELAKQAKSPNNNQFDII